MDDHNSALWAILNRGRIGETYKIGGENEWENIKLVHVLCEKMAKAMAAEPETYRALITHVDDRSGHDRNGDFLIALPATEAFQGLDHR